MSWLLLSGALVLFLTSGAILGAALGLTGLLLLHFQANGATPLAINATWNMLTDFTLSAVPLFIFLGEILLASGVSKRVYNGLTPLFARVPGQLLHTNIAVCTLFGAVSGSSTSTAAAIGAVGYPELTKRGYKPSVVVGTLAARGHPWASHSPQFGINHLRSDSKRLYRATLYRWHAARLTHCCRLFHMDYDPL
tara:strand:- start:872 stop:1453 length:582 start_codon:yes stop_codon:yes gene_type:complete